MSRGFGAEQRDQSGVESSIPGIGDDDIPTSARMEVDGNDETDDIGLVGTSAAIRSKRLSPGSPGNASKASNKKSNTQRNKNKNSVKSASAAHTKNSNTLQDSNVDTDPLENWQRVVNKLGAYKYHGMDAEFCRSYKSHRKHKFDIGCRVAPTKNEMRISSTFASGHYDAVFEKYETSIFQGCMLRSKAFRVTWELLSGQINQCIRDHVKSGAGAILDAFDLADVVGNDLLQIVTAHVGVDVGDQDIILDILCQLLDIRLRQNTDDSLSASDTSYTGVRPDSYLYIRLKAASNAKETLEQIYTALKMRHVASQRLVAANEKDNEAGKKPLVDLFLELYRRFFKGKTLVIVLDETQSIVADILHFLLLLKRTEGVPIICIQCATSCQNQLENYCSRALYSSLVLSEVHVVSPVKIADEILELMLLNYNIQTFIPNFWIIKQIWDLFYDVDLSLVNLVKRLHLLYETYYGNYYFSFLNSPNIIDLGKLNDLDEYGKPMYDADECAKDLYARYVLLCIGAGLGESHAAYLELKTGECITVSEMIYEMLPKESIMLYERRVSVQLALGLLYDLLALVPGVCSARKKLATITACFTSKEPEPKLLTVIKKVTRIIQQQQRVSRDVTRNLLKFGRHLIFMYPLLKAILVLLDKPLPQLDLAKMLPCALDPKANAQTVGNFIKDALLALLFPMPGACTRLAAELLLQRPHVLKSDWNIVRKFNQPTNNSNFTLEQQQHHHQVLESNPFLGDLDVVINIVKALPCKSISMWQLFCLFYRHSNDRKWLTKCFVRFTMAVETLVQVLGYLELRAKVRTGSESVTLLEEHEEFITSCREMQELLANPQGIKGANTNLELAMVIKQKIEPLKVLRVHLGS